MVFTVHALAIVLTGACAFQKAVKDMFIPVAQRCGGSWILTLIEKAELNFSGLMCIQRKVCSFVIECCP
jgi:hypothetical protein